MPIRCFFILCLYLISNSAFSQDIENFESALMEMKGGAEVVYSSNSHSFTFDIISNKIKPLEKPGYVLVDNKTLQFICIGNKALVGLDTSVATQKGELLGYMKYETDYVKNDVKLNISNIDSEWLMLNGKLFLLWHYDMPDDGKPVKAGTFKAVKQINLSAVCFEHVLNLNMPLISNEKYEDNKILLTHTAETLKQYNAKTDFKELYQKLQQQIKQ